MAITDTKGKRLGIIVVVAVLGLGGLSIFDARRTALADRDADRVEAAVRDLVAGLDYEEAAAYGLEDFEVEGVEPNLLGGVPGFLTVGWEVGKWGKYHCIRAEWEMMGPTAVVTRADC